VIKIISVRLLQMDISLRQMELLQNVIIPNVLLVLNQRPTVFYPVMKVVLNAMPQTFVKLVSQEIMLPLQVELQLAIIHVPLVKLMILLV
jgi:hypothetical protein